MSDGTVSVVDPDTGEEIANGSAADMIAAIANEVRTSLDAMQDELEGREWDDTFEFGIVDFAKIADDYDKAYDLIESFAPTPEHVKAQGPAAEEMYKLMILSGIDPAAAQKRMSEPQTQEILERRQKYLDLASDPNVDPMELLGAQAGLAMGLEAIVDENGDVWIAFAAECDTADNSKGGPCAEELVAPAMAFLQNNLALIMETMNSKVISLLQNGGIENFDTDTLTAIAVTELADDLQVLAACLQQIDSDPELRKGMQSAFEGATRQDLLDSGLSESQVSDIFGGVQTVNFFETISGENLKESVSNDGASIYSKVIENGFWNQGPDSIMGILYLAQAPSYEIESLKSSFDAIKSLRAAYQRRNLPGCLSDPSSQECRDAQQALFEKELGIERGAECARYPNMCQFVLMALQMHPGIDIAMTVGSALNTCNEFGGGSTECLTAQNNLLPALMPGPNVRAGGKKIDEAVDNAVRDGDDGATSGRAGSGTLTPIDNPVDLTDFRRDHILNGHRAGAGKPGKTEFPAKWEDDRIIHQVSDIATDPNATRGLGQWDSPYAIGTRDGIEIRVDFYPDFKPNGQPHPRAGTISTAYPINTPANP